ncbi:MAG: glycosyltransferase family 39 protein [Candidatus Omnitrophica bacterium]|nr:glycosyltransferase family 39 protein [Candidatus Omnitrophota bacterium]MDD5553399.1 glycosyltransferase family 39 protein [Candidatus Omnitrophota bacterium]
MKKVTLLLLGAIIVTSMGMNYYRLNESRMFAFDEGVYFNVVKTMRAPFEFLYSKMAGRPEYPEFSEYIKKKAGYNFMAGKPTYLLLALTGSFIIGLKDFTLPAVSAFFGVLTVLLAFFIARKIRDDSLGIMSAFILSVSWFFVTYSRSAFPHITGTFFAYLALLLHGYSGKSRKYVFFYGFSLGLAITSHYAFFWLAAIFGLVESYYFLRMSRSGLKTGLIRIFIWAGALALPVVFWQASTWMVRHWIYANPLYADLVRGASGEGAFKTYFGQLFTQAFSGNRQTGYEGNAAFYLKVILAKEGLPFAVFFVCGVILILKDIIRSGNGRLDRSLLLLYFFVPFTLFGVYSHFPTTRTLSIAVPAMCFIAAYPVSLLFAKKNKIPAILSAGVLAAAQLSSSLPVLSYRSGFPEAISYMKRHKGIRHLSSNYYISRVYAERGDVYDMSFSFRKKEADTTGKLHIDAKKVKDFAAEKGFNYVLLDQYRYSYPNEILAAANKIRPVFTTPHTTINYLYDSKKEYQDQIINAPRVIDIYDLNEVVKKVGEAEDAKK